MLPAGTLVRPGKGQGITVHIGGTTSVQRHGVRQEHRLVRPGVGYRGAVLGRVIVIVIVVIVIVVIVVVIVVVISVVIASLIVIVVVVIVTGRIVV